MGVDLVKDSQGNENLEINNEYFNYDNNLDEDIDSYEELQILGIVDNCKTLKVHSKLNDKIYVIKDLILSEEIEKRKNLVDIINLLRFNEHPNIVKYHKFFIKEEKHLYVIEEFINNWDLKVFLRTYKDLKKSNNFIINKKIEENILWDIFMQCANALKFLHEKNIIHRNICLDNILISNDRTIKFCNFKRALLINGNKNRFNEEAGEILYRSPEMDNNSSYGKKTDVYSLGVVFHKLCTFEFPINYNPIENINNYSKEMMNIIKLMLKEEKYRPDSNTLYEMIFKEYSKRVAKLSSIESIIRCMNSFQNFSEYMLKNKIFFQNEGKTPFSFNYINCIEEFKSNNDKSNYCLYLNNLRNLLNNIDCEISKKQEMSPLMVLDYLVEKLNKETSEKENQPSFKVQKTNEFDNKNNAILKYEDSMKNNYTSGFSKFFCSKLKTARILCNNVRLYYFTAMPYIEFQLDRCYCQEIKNGPYKYNPKFEMWLKMQQNHAKKITEKIECKNCIGKHFEFKMIEKFGNNLIIAINRGKDFSNHSEVENELTFESIIDKKDGINMIKNIFKLVGVIKRVYDENDKNFEYFVSENLDYSKGLWTTSEENLDENKNRKLKKDVVMLFYSVEEQLINKNISHIKNIY